MGTERCLPMSSARISTLTSSKPAGSSTLGDGSMHPLQSMVPTARDYKIAANTVGKCGGGLWGTPRVVYCVVGPKVQIVEDGIKPLCRARLDLYEALVGLAVVAAQLLAIN